MNTSHATPKRVRAAHIASLTASILLAAVRVAAADRAAFPPMAAGTATAQPTAIPDTDDATPRQRPRIGLVLGGGGAKGAAHVGVLAALEELRVPIDCVVGTSMGALVGGNFAAGRTAHEVEEAVRAISWQDAIARRGLRSKVPMRRKLAGGTYSNGLEFGVRDGGLIAPSGFFSTQNIDLTIQYLVARSRNVTDFDRLDRLCEAFAVDRVVHTAARLSSSIRADPLAGVRVNALGTANVLELARRRSIRRTVLASSTSVTYPVFGSFHGSALPEDFSMRVVSESPGSIYAAAKLFAEHLALFYARSYGLAVVALR